MTRPLLLDLFCGAGGAAKGYYEAGFLVVGVDINHQPRYPYQFYQGDAMEEMNRLITSGDIQMFHAIHASPPCQHYSKMSTCIPGLKDKYPDLIDPTRQLLIKTGLPYVIENVEGAPMINPVKLCGSHFDLTTIWEPHGKVGLRRHRLFETNFPVPDPGIHDHSLRAVPVYGHGSGNTKSRLKGKGLAATTRAVMEIDWMNREELDESIPPAYTRYIGQYLLEHVNGGILSGQQENT